MTWLKKAETETFPAGISLVRIRIQAAQRQLTRLACAHPACVADLLPALKLAEELSELLEKIHREKLFR